MKHREKLQDLGLGNFFFFKASAKASDNDKNKWDYIKI